MKELFIFAGELSADLHGEKLIHSLLKQDPHLKIFGVAGPRMRTTGIECILPMEAFQVMGFIDVIAALPKLIKNFFFLRKQILDRCPETALFIDYADFNMRMEASLRKKGYRGRLIHYISPSVWAWRKNRIETLSKNLNLLLVIYPFEVELFSHTNLQTVYVGHPLIQRINEHFYRDHLFAHQNILSLFPGSRRKEIERNLPLMLKAIKKLHVTNSPVVVLSLSHPRFQQLVKQMIENEGLHPQVTICSSENNYELMKASKAALAKSGTVTLELALHEVPTVVVYEISLLDKWIGIYLFKIILPYYCIVNIILKNEVFPEFVDHQIDSDKVSEKLQAFLAPSKERESCQQACRELSSLLTNKISSDEAARMITSFN